MPRLFSAKVLGYFLILMVLDVSVVPAAHLFFGARPILLYLIVIYAGFEWHWTRTVPVAIGVGLARDFLSSQPFGAEAVSLVIASLALNFYIRKVQTASSLMRMIGTFLFVFLTLHLTSVFAGLLGVDTPWNGMILFSYFLSSLATALLMPLFFILTRQWFQEIHPLRAYPG